jgi:MoxR-like ATPase
VPTDTLKDLELLVRSRYGLIWLETREEERAGGLLHHLADALGVSFFTWTRTGGLRVKGSGNAVYGTEAPVKALQHVRSSSAPALYHFRDLGGALAGDGGLAAHLRDVAGRMESVEGAVVLTGEGVEIPATLRERTAHVTLPGPSEEEFRRLLSDLLRDLSARGHVEVEMTREEMATLVGHLSGLTLMEAEKILTKAVVEDGRLAPDDIRHVIEAKRRVVEREGLLEYYPADTTLAGVADLATLKGWLSKRRAVIHDPERARSFGLEFPRGVLLLGVPGCGKSLSAKAVAAEWRLPLLKLDPSNLYNKYVGESEGNFKRAVRAAERMAPVVLWIDELEKAFASGGSEDGGVSQRILGSFLGWMQDRRGDVFVVATANDVQALPPELLRKGRFDEIFFVDLPDHPTRAEIFRIHLEGRGRQARAFDLEALAAETDGFSGSEIEQTVVGALYTAFSGAGAVDTETIRAEIVRTRPLSVTMAEKVEAMRTWARERTVPAN